MCADVHEPLSFKQGMMTDTAKLYILYTSLNDLDHYLSSQGHEKVTTSAPFISQNSQFL